MKIRAILACDDNWGIGKDGDLPWPRNSADLKWFKDNTVGQVVVMGKNTWDSLPSKPLPKRNNIIISSSKDYGPYHFININEAHGYLTSMAKIQDVWIIGGAKLIEGLIDIIEEFWLSRIEGNYDCDTFLPRQLIEEKYTMYSSQHIDDLYIDKWRRI